MKIGIAFNLKEELCPAAQDAEQLEEFDLPSTIEAICGVFEKNGFETVKLGGGAEIIDKIRTERVDFVFNIAEGHYGRNRESHVPAILEMLNMPYSGSDPLTLGLTLDKTITKKIALQADIPTPRYTIIENTEDLYMVECQLRYPVIIKPAWEGSSKGIYNSSKVENRKGLEDTVKILLERYPNQPLLAEEYISGQEITVGVVGNSAPRVLGIMEIVNKKNPGEDFFYSIEVKRDWVNLVDYASPPNISALMQKDIREYAVYAFKEFGCRDMARLDFRVSRQNEIFLLEINPLPGLSPEYADLVIMARKQDVEYEELVLSILNCGLSRYGLSKASVATRC